MVVGRFLLCACAGKNMPLREFLLPYARLECQLPNERCCLISTAVSRLNSACEGCPLSPESFSLPFAPISMPRPLRLVGSMFAVLHVSRRKMTQEPVQGRRLKRVDSSRFAAFFFASARRLSSSAMDDSFSLESSSRVSRACARALPLLFEAGDFDFESLGTDFLPRLADFESGLTRGVPFSA